MRRAAALHSAGVVLLVAASLAAQSFNSEAEARFNIGISHIREGRYDMAIETIKQAIKGDPKNAFFHKWLGTAYAAKQKWPEAIEAYRKALVLNPYYVDVKNDLGTALILSGKRDEGKSEFLALFSDPTNPTPEITARNLGQAYLEEKNWGEAANWFKTAITRAKNYSEAYLGAADAFLGMGRLEDAVSTLEAGLKEVPDDPRINLALGQAYFNAGRFSEARARLEHVARRDPTSPAGKRAAELLRDFPK
jgi:Tfp pilus assembly protein PilF